MALEKTVEKQDRLTIVRLKGDFEVSVAEDFIEYIRGLCEEGSRHFYFDLSGIETIDSSGLGSLVRLLTTVRRMDGSIHLKRPPEKAYKVFKITRLDSFFNFVEDEAEAKERIDR